MLGFNRSGHSDIFRIFFPIAKSGFYCKPQFAKPQLSSILQRITDKSTAQQQSYAFIDTSNCLDPVFAEAAGVDFSHFLWVRCAKKHKKMNAVEQAFKAADILLHNGGFAVVVIDLFGVTERLIRKIPLTTWHRFSRAAERTSTTLIFLTSVPVALSSANITLHIKQSSGIWTTVQELNRSIDAHDLPHAQILSGLDANCEVVREKLRKPIQNLNAKLTYIQLSKRA